MKLKNNRGFTLIELILVLVILGILSALAIPNIAKVSGHYSLNTATMEIAQSIRYAQQAAVNYNVDVIFELDIHNNSYRVKENRTPYRLFRKGQLSKDIIISTNLYNPGYGGNYSGIRTLLYSPSGLPSRTGTIWVKSQSGEQKRITIAVGTGRVKILE